jgi:hypothetical protein
MATLVPTDYDALRNSLYLMGAGKEEMKAMSHLPNVFQLLAAFQAIETFWENNKASLKAQVDVAYGQTTSAALAKKIMIAWLNWKIKQ